MAQKWGLWTALSCGDCFGLFGAFGSCFHPYRRHHSGLKGFYIFCSQRKCTLCLKWEEEDQRHHGGKLCRKLVWIIDVGVKFCEELKRAAAVSCWGVFLRFVRLFFVCVCGCWWLCGSKSTSVCLHKDNLVPLLYNVVFKFKGPAWAETVKCLQIVS